SEQAREGRHAWPYLSPAQIFSRVLLGAGAAALSLLLVLGIAEGETSAPAIGILGTFWTLLYTGLFLLSSHRELGPASRAALTSVGVSLILAAPLSIPRVVETCIRLVQAAAGSVSVSLVLLLLAAGYTVGPLLVGGAVFGRPRPDCWVSHGATHSLLYALVIAPAIYLQCLSLSFPVAAVWTAGAILGTVLGGPLGFRLAGRGSETT
ncbi:MAG: hypothetical protein HYY65_04730, partial [Candidatus Tectomicrobia bacterium]|nr:hypothetical protein [Candidatus Tectomicrobia bacterium]